MIPAEQIQQLIQQHCKQPGFFVEIGCWDGTHLSNTKQLEDNGWDGICVDPFPKNFEKRKCQLIKKAVHPIGGPQRFVKVTIDRRYGGDVSYFSGFEDTIQNSPAIWDLIQQHCDYEIIGLDCVTTSDILPNDRKHIDFISIDTEGSELSIIKTIDFNIHTFGLIMVEHNQNEKRKSDLRMFLNSKGYMQFEETDLDYFFKPIL